ncbi:MAG: APC family permease, partial [Myxococcota bacterium]
MSRSAGRIGWLLVWAVVFCDIGSSVYYVPGILWNATGDLAGFYVLTTLVAFVLLSIKVVEVTRRFASGGGVVSLADKAFGPWWGCAGGQLVMVDYFLTVAISAASAVYYLDRVAPLGGAAIPVMVLAIMGLAAINVVGIKESARVSTVLALAAFAVNLAVIVTALLRAPVDVLLGIPRAFAMLGSVSPAEALVGYAGAWLAFSGLESLAQLAPAMRDLQDTPRRGMIAVVTSVLLTAPVLTLLSVASLDPATKAAESERFVAVLAGVWGGFGLELAVVLTAVTLLFLAANTAVLGNYHVQLALTRRDFLPASLTALSHRYQTPWRAILLCTALPVVVLLAAKGDMTVLGNLYAFGLLGGFVLTSVGIDLLRWRDGERGGMFWLGVLTSVAIVLAFVVNLVAKPMATAFGGGLTLLGMLVAVGTHSGWFERAIAKIPRMAPPREVLRAAEVPFYTLA